MVGPIAHDDLPGLRHAFLIRDPARVVAVALTCQLRARKSIQAHSLF